MTKYGLDGEIIEGSEPVEQMSPEDFMENFVEEEENGARGEALPCLDREGQPIYVGSRVVMDKDGRGTAPAPHTATVLGYEDLESGKKLLHVKRDDDGGGRGGGPAYPETDGQPSWNLRPSHATVIEQPKSEEREEAGEDKNGTPMYIGDRVLMDTQSQVKGTLWSVHPRNPSEFVAVKRDDKLQGGGPPDDEGRRTHWEARSTLVVLEEDSEEPIETTSDVAYDASGNAIVVGSRVEINAEWAESGETGEEDSRPVQGTVIHIESEDVFSVLRDDDVPGGGHNSAWECNAEHVTRIA